MPYLVVPACFFAGDEPVFLWCICGVPLEGAVTGILGFSPVPVPNFACFLRTSRGGLASVVT